MDSAFLGKGKEQLLLKRNKNDPDVLTDHRMARSSSFSHSLFLLPSLSSSLFSFKLHVSIPALHESSELIRLALTCLGS